jgi:predicted naringenin-chalcone synthase
MNWDIADDKPEMKLSNVLPALVFADLIVAESSRLTCLGLMTTCPQAWITHLEAAWSI